MSDSEPDKAKQAKSRSKSPASLRMATQQGQNDMLLGEETLNDKSEDEENDPGSPVSPSDDEKESQQARDTKRQKMQTAKGDDGSILAAVTGVDEKKLDNKNSSTNSARPNDEKLEEKKAQITTSQTTSAKVNEKPKEAKNQAGEITFAPEAVAAPIHGMLESPHDKEEKELPKEAEEAKPRSLDSDESDNEMNEAKQEDDNDNNDRIERADMLYQEDITKRMQANKAIWPKFVEALRGKKPVSQIPFPDPIIWKQDQLRDFGSTIRYNTYALQGWIAMLKQRFQAAIGTLVPYGLQYTCLHPILYYMDEEPLEVMYLLEKIEDENLEYKDYEFKLLASLGVPDCNMIADANRQNEEIKQRRERRQGETPKIADTEPIANFALHYNEFNLGKPQTELEYTMINCKKNAMLTKLQANLKSTGDTLAAIDPPKMSGIIAALILELGLMPYYQADNFPHTVTTTGVEMNARDYTVQWTCIGCGSPADKFAFAGFYIQGSSVNDNKGAFRTSGACCSKSCALRALLRAIEDAIAFNEYGNSRIKREYSSAVISLTLNEAKIAFKFQLEEDKRDQHAIKNRVGNRDVQDLKLITKTFENAVDNLKEHDNEEEEVLLLAELFFPLSKKAWEEAKSIQGKAGTPREKTEKLALTAEMMKNTERIEEVFHELRSANTAVDEKFRKTNSLFKTLAEKGMGSDSAQLQHAYISIDGTEVMRQIAVNVTKIGAFFENGISPMLTLLVERLKSFNKEIGDTHMLKTKRDQEGIKNILEVLQELHNRAKAAIEMHEKVKMIFDKEKKRFLKPVEHRDQHDLFQWLKTRAAEEVGTLRKKLSDLQTWSEEKNTMERKLQEAHDELSARTEADLREHENRALQVALLESQIEEVKREQKQLEEKQKQIDSEKASIAKQREESEKNSELLKRIPKKDTSAQEIADLQATLAKATAANNQLRTEAATQNPKRKQQEIDTLKVNAEKLKSEIAQLKSENALLKQTKEDQEKAWREAVALKEAKIATMQKTAQSLDLTGNQDDQIKEMKDNHAREITAWREKSLQEARRYESLQKTSKEEKSQALQAQRKIEAVSENKIKELENKIRQQDDEISLQQSEYSKTADELDQNIIALKQKQIKLDEQKKYSEELRARKDEYKSREAKAKERYEEADKRIKSIQEAAIGNQKEVQRLLQEIQVSKNRPEGTPQDSESLQRKTAEIKANKIEIEKLTQELSYLKKTCFESEQQMTRHYAENLRVSSLYQNALADFAEARAHRDSLHAQTEDQKRRIEQLMFENMKLRQTDKEQKQFQITQQIKDTVKTSLRSLTPDTTTESQTSQASHYLAPSSFRSMSADGRLSFQQAQSSSSSSRYIPEQQSSSSSSRYIPEQQSSSSSLSFGLMPPPIVREPSNYEQGFGRKYEDVPKQREEKRTGRSRERSKERDTTADYTDRSRSREEKVRSRSRGASPLPTSDATMMKQLHEEAEKNKKLELQIAELKEAQRNTQNDKNARSSTSFDNKSSWSLKEDNESASKRELSRADSERDTNAQKREQRERSYEQEDREQRDRKRDKRNTQSREEKDEEERAEKEPDKRRTILRKTQKNDDQKKDWCFTHWDELEAGRNGCTKRGCKFDHTEERQPCWSWDTGCARGETCKYQHVNEEAWRSNHPEYPERPSQRDNKRKTAPSKEGMQANKKPDNRKQTPCRFYNSRSGCNKRNECPYLHSDAKQEDNESRKDRKNKTKNADDDDINDDSFDDTAQDEEPKGKIDDRSARRKT